MRPLVSSMLHFLVATFLSVGISHACTSFCLDTPDGSFYATNLDLITGEGHVFINRRGIAKEGYGENTAGETLKWSAQYGSVTFNLVGRELPWGGMNEAGLVISTMQLNASRCPAPDERPPLGEAFIVQFLLDSCANVQEAIRLASTVRLAQNECKSHYLIADETGDCAAVEVERVAAAADKANGFEHSSGVSPVDYSLDVLTEVVVAPKKWWSNMFNEPYTRWNVVFDISRREVYFRTGDHSKVRHISLHNFSLSCDAPLLMLDVNEKLEGAVDRLFQPYDHDTNLKVFSTTCGKLGIDVSEENAVVLVEFFESFECAH